MDSWFASPERAPIDKIAETVEFASRNAVVDGLLRTSGGLVAILNEQRQIIAINDSFLSALGIVDAGVVLGLRPGEAIRCVHARDMPGGCGTSRHCATCGAAIAIVAALAGPDPVERRCVATVVRNGVQTDICLSVRAARIDIEGHRLVLLFLMDISTQQKQLAFERLFFHDISNLVMGLQGTAHMLAWKPGNESESGRKIARMSDRLAHEIKIQRALLHDETADYPLEIEAVDIRAMLAELGDLFASHPAAKGKRIRVECAPAVETVLADPHLLLRILANMTTNALEATEPGGEVRLDISRVGDEIAFCAWNRAQIPEEVALRIFQRYFSTKGNSGRGLGTYSMKLFGEQLLGGKMSFSSSETDGTTFRLELPS